MTTRRRFIAALGVAVAAPKSILLNGSASVRPDHDHVIMARVWIAGPGDLECSFCDYHCIICNRSAKLFGKLGAGGWFRVI